MSLRDDIRVAAEREGITASTKERRLYGLYGESWWDHEPMRNPEAIRAERERQEAARAKHARDLDEADRLMAERVHHRWPTIRRYQEAAE